MSSAGIALNDVIETSHLGREQTDDHAHSRGAQQKPQIARFDYKSNNCSIDRNATLEEATLARSTRDASRMNDAQLRMDEKQYSQARPLDCTK